MALSAGEFYSGGQVCDTRSRTVMISETTGAALTAGERFSGGYLRDPDGRMVICQDAAHSALSAGEQYTAGDVRDAVGRVVCAAETVNTALSAGSQFSGGFLRDSCGRRIIALDTLGAVLSAGEQYSAGQVFDSAGRLVLASESVTLAYNATVMADTPFGFWPMNEPSGTAAVDASGNGHNGVYGGTLTLGAAGPCSDGQTGAAFGSGGTATWGAIGTVSQPFTVEVFINTANTQSVGISSRQPSDNSFDLQLTAGHFTACDLGTGAAWIDTGVVGTTATSTSTWFHVAHVVDATSLKTYVNGVVDVNKPESSAAALLLDVNHTLKVSMTFASVAKLAIYSTALSAARVAAHYAAH